MKRMLPNFRLFLLAACILASTAAAAQDIHFSQFFETPLYRNPALAGLVNGDVRIQAVYRSQWNSIANAYKTVSLNGEYKMLLRNDDYITLGAQLYRDEAGTASLSTTQVLPAINFHKSMSQERNVYLSAGFMGGLVQRSVNRSKMTTANTFTNGNDGEQNFTPGYTYFDASAGMSLNMQLGENERNNLVVGAAYHHFNKPRNSFFNNGEVITQPKWVYSADVKLDINEESFVAIHNDHSRQGSYSQTMSGMLFGWRIGGYTETPDYVLRAGGFLRWGDAVIPTIQLDYQPFAFGLSYDVNISPLAANTRGRGGFELSLKYVGFLNRENSSMNAVRCPRF